MKPGVTSVLLTVSTVKERSVLNVTHHISLISMDSACRIVVMETSVMTKLVLVMYVMRLVLFAMVVTVVNAQLV